MTLEQLEEMYRMQKELDEIMQAPPRRKPTYEEIKMAMFDEVGEVIHELKGEWCYWKLTQKPVDREKVLEELADVMHFALSLDLNDPRHLEGIDRVMSGFKNGNKPNRIFEIVACNEYYGEDVSIHGIVTEIEWKNDTGWSRASVFAFCLAQYAGFTCDEVYEAYKRKNRINIQRMQEGY